MHVQAFNCMVVVHLSDVSTLHAILVLHPAGMATACMHTDRCLCRHMEHQEANIASAINEQCLKGIPMAIEVILICRSIT